MGRSLLRVGMVRSAVPGELSRLILGVSVLPLLPIPAFSIVGSRRRCPPGQLCRLLVSHPAGGTGDRGVYDY